MAENCNNNAYDGERYERYNFDDVTEDDYIVADILINLEPLIHNFNETNSHEAEPLTTCSFKSSSSYEPHWSIKARNLFEPLWQNKKKRSALESPPSPLPPRRIEMKNEGNKFQNIRIRDTGEKQENMVYSPSSPLSYEPNEDAIANNNILSKHHLKHKCKKRKVQDWEDHIRELEQTKQQLKLSLDNVRKYHQTLLDLNIRLKAKRDEKNGESRRKNVPMKVNGGFDLNCQTGPGHHQFPVFAKQQKEEYAAYQNGGDGLRFNYYSVPFLQANVKVLQAAEARRRRKIKINSKKNSNRLKLY